ncbi:MAG: 30S ribosomal protein S2, partial [Kiritimatiellia bacterium]|nr:30S ribosomal protein S2 [Kiritimatiellia bacterium]
KRWNPKMKRYIFGARNGIYIIDLEKTLVGLHAAKHFIRTLVQAGRSVLFVGTKKQAQEAVRTVATSTGQPYIVTRWLGGTLTNNRTIRQSVARMRKLEGMEKSGAMEKLPKKEVSALRLELKKLQTNLSGIADMEEMPGALFILDTCRDAIAVQEAKRMNIPVIAMVDTNADPSLIDYPIPGNDDAIRAIRLVLSDVQAAIQEARETFAQAAAERAQRRAIVEAEERAKQKAIEEERKLRDREGRKQRAEAIQKIKSKAPAKAKVAKEAGDTETADAPAPDKPVKKTPARKAAEPKAEAAPAEEAPTATE